jgi:hypothetical protein
MASQVTDSPGGITHERLVELLVRTAVFAALAVAGLLAAVGSENGWGTAAGLVCIGLAIGGIAISLGALMAERDGEPRPARAGRALAVVHAALAVAALIVALAV